MTVYELIERQQKGMDGTAVWMVGEQLKDICHREPDCEAILAEDLQNPDMCLAKAERKIEAYAKAHKKGNVGCCPPQEAEKILREFYGLPGAGDAPSPSPASGKILSLADLM